MPLLGAALLGSWWALLEHRLVYVPGRSLAATPEDYGLRYRRLSLRAADGVRLMAWSLPRAPDAPWLIYFHGNAQNVSRYLPLTVRLHTLGFNVLMPEYRGYGESEGVPGEAGLYLDARAAYGYLRGRGVAGRDIAVYGYSLGTGVAVDLSAQAEIGALILEAPFTSIPAVARASYRVVPRRLLRNRFDSLSKIGKVAAPKLFIHAADDRTVPIRQGRELYGAAAGPKRFVEILGGHVAMLRQDPDQDALDAIRAFAGCGVRP